MVPARQASEQIKSDQRLDRFSEVVSGTIGAAGLLRRRPALLLVRQQAFFFQVSPNPPSSPSPDTASRCKGSLCSAASTIRGPTTGGGRNRIGRGWSARRDRR